MCDLQGTVSSWRPNKKQDIIPTEDKNDNDNCNNKTENNINGNNNENEVINNSH